MRTLCIDIGGTGIKAMVVDEVGVSLSPHARVGTPRPASPEAVLPAIQALVADLGDYDRVSVGFPGVVVDGVTKTAPNLDAGWADLPLANHLAEALGKPVRAANDAGVQGLGVIEGSGTEIVVTLGTGMGFGLYIDGRYVPNIELGHHPFEDGASYEDRVRDAALAEVGEGAWKARVARVLAQLAATFNFRRLYLGGGNARLFAASELPEGVVAVDNVAGLLGGVRLWEVR